MNDFLSPAKEEWYGLLIEDLQDIIVERTFNANWEKIQGHWEVGRRILQDNQHFEDRFIYGKQVAVTVAQSLNVSRRHVYRCIRFARKYPNLNVTWNKIIREYLPNNKKGEENDGNTKSKTGGANQDTTKIDTKSIVPFSSPEEYKEYVQSQQCAICGKLPPSNFAHFPVTRAQKDEHWGIPLCGECHSEQHVDDFNFCWKYRRKWAEYLFGLILNGISQ